MNRNKRSNRALIGLGLVVFIGVARFAQAIDHTKGPGEPYALAGKRMVFTNWLFLVLRPRRPTRLGGQQREEHFRIEHG